MSLVTSNSLFERLNRPVTDYLILRRVISFLIRNRRFHIPREKVKKSQYLSLGCGPDINPDYINLDYLWSLNLDICWDLTKGIPLESGTMKGIFTEHCLEHLEFEDGAYVLSECWRVLKPGGILRITVPDGELYLSRYNQIMNGDAHLEMPLSRLDLGNEIYTPMMSVNRVFGEFGHKFIYDFDTLSKLLEKLNFVDIRKESFKSGYDPKLILDTDKRAVESLYVEASKPA